ncbi:MAG: T9SS type A sorting domain-containing protein [Bacteroidia bacterium]|nr:T9SS type A sorting domain-containing protein [Bacteroidia bacterium]
MFKYFLLLALLPMVALQSRAGSILGGEITYQNLNSDTVIVRMVLYRDCSQSLLDSVQKIVFTTLGCSTNKSDTALIKRRTVSSADLLCSTTTSMCSGGSFSPGIQEHVYLDTFNLQQVFTGGLAASCCNLRISFSYSSRAYTTNIAGGYPFYLETTLNRCVVNKSVTFFNKPFFTIRAMASFQYTNGAMEPEGDSLVYELTQPIYAANSNIPYVNGFGNYFPILFNFLGFPSVNLPCPAGIHYNKGFDNFDFTAAGGQNPTLNYRISEWRRVNGVMTKISSVLRDFVFNSNSYPANAAPAFGLVQMFTAPWCYVPFPPDNECNSNSEKYFHVTVGQRICFWVVAADTAAGDTTTITWNGGLPGASFASANQNGNVKQSDTAFICWTPTINQYRKEPYFFALTLTDKACPIRNRISRNQLVTVGPAYFPRSIIRNGNGNYTFRMDYLSEVTNPSISWKLSLNRFAVFDTSNSVTYNGNPVNHTFTQNGKYILRSTIQSGLTGVAVFYDTITVCDFAPVAKAGADTTLCKNNFIKLVASPAGGVWSGAALQNDTFYANSAGTFTMMYTLASDSFGCTPRDTIKITVRNLSAPVVTTVADTTLCKGNAIALSGTPSGGIWSGPYVTQNVFSAFAAGLFTVTYTFTDSFSCSGSASTKIKVKQARPVSFTQSSVVSCTDTGTINLSQQTGALPLGGNWIASDVGKNACGNNGNWSLACLGVSANCHRFAYIFTDTNQCVSVDSACLFVRILPVVNSNADTTVCQQAGWFPLLASPSGGVWSTTTGVPMNGNLFNGNQNAGYHQYVYSYTDGFGCSNTDTTHITIMWVEFNASPSGGGVPLNISFINMSNQGYDKWLWKFGDGDSSSLIAPSHTYTTPNYFTVSLTGISNTHHCSYTLTKPDFILAIFFPPGSVYEPTENPVLIYPNPANEEITINTENWSEIKNIQLINAIGVTVLEEVLTGNLTSLSTRQIPTGMYILKVSDKSGRNSSSKLIIYR